LLFDKLPIELDVYAKSFSPNKSFSKKTLFRLRVILAGLLEKLFVITKWQLYYSSDNM
jgi:hypothetical protein